MSTSDIIARWQAIVASLMLIIAVVGAVLAVLGYLRVIKSIDDNAKERQDAINSTAEKASQLFLTTTEQTKRTIRKDQLLLGTLGLFIVFIVAWGSHNP